jgi:hypothetical protein
MRLQQFERRTSKMSMDGWWMVHTTVRPVLTVLRTVRMTMAAARASRPETNHTGLHCCASNPCSPVSSVTESLGQHWFRDKPSNANRRGSPQRDSAPDVGSSMKMMDGLDTCITYVQLSACCVQQVP